MPMSQPESLSIENEAVHIVVLPGYGARVTSLIDKRSGRDWLAPGGISANTGEDAVYSAGEAVGWDECFPTVSRWDASDTPWRRNLRDHGDLWGRPWQLLEAAPSLLRLSFAGTGFRFTRTLSLEGPAVNADYLVENTGGEPLPFMWALHALLIALPGETIELPGVNDVAAAFAALDGRRLDFANLSWPGLSTAVPFPLDKVQSVDTRFAAKLYAPDVRHAAVGGLNGRLVLDWEGIDHLGIWLTYGAWPQPGPIHHVALEPTTAPIDHLGQGIANGSAVTLAPGAETRWRARLTLEAPVG